MRQKKNSKIILIAIIILVILILLAGVGYAYFATDAFKSNKDLFFKYIKQIGAEKESFIETPLKEYFEKQKNTPYLNEGNLSVNITASRGQEQFENTNNTNLTFEGQVDKANAKRMENISLNYSDTVKFPVSYKQIGDTLGIQTKHIGSKYIAIHSDSKQNVTQNIKGIEKVQELSEVEWEKEDLQRVQNTYFNLLNEVLQNNYFSKIEEADSKGYKLTLNGESLKNIMVKMLETLKNDQATLDKINEYIKIQKNSSKITASSIENEIKNINNNSDLNNENLEITVYQTKGKISSLTIKTNEVEIKIGKTVTGNDLQYNVELQIRNQEQEEKINLIAKFAGLQSMQNISENYELTLETEEIKYQYNYNNNVEFAESSSIEEFSDNNTLMLDEMEKEQKDTFLNAVIERIQSVNKEQMEELGISENENPLQYVIPQFGIFSSSMNAVDLDEVEVNTYNTKFEAYESTNLKGVTVKGLLSTIQINNENQEDENQKIKEIHFDGQEYEVTDQNITFLKSSVETETAYRVEFEKDEDTGIIYRAVINKK